MSQLDQILVAVFLFLTMFGMGATLSLPDFRKVARQPRPLLVGLANQFLWMPLMAFGLATLFGFPGPAAVGLIVMGCSTGGTTSNLFTYYARADLALSISMTVTSTVAAVAIMPLMLAIYTASFTSDELTIPFANVVTTLVAILIPVSAGIALRTWRPSAASRAEKIGSISGIAVLVAVIVSSAIRDWERVASFTAEELLAASLLGPLGFAFGWLGASLLGVGTAQRRAISLETGIQNAPLAIGIVIASFSGAIEEEALRLPLLYGVLVVPASALLAFWFRGQRADQNA
jgi:BASS family bile acid:Na+ symporter